MQNARSKITIKLEDFESAELHAFLLQQYILVPSFSTKNIWDEKLK